MKSNNNLVIATLSILFVVLTFACSLKFINQGGVLGEATIAPRPWLTRTQPSPRPTGYRPTPTHSVDRSIPCNEISRIYKTHCPSSNRDLCIQINKIYNNYCERPIIIPTEVRRPTQGRYPTSIPTPTPSDY